MPGIAGIVLSIGMAVDSNVLIFERMREELALALLIGVVVGTSSSIFVASPIVFIWETWQKKELVLKGK